MKIALVGSGYFGTKLAQALCKDHVVRMGARSQGAVEGFETSKLNAKNPTELTAFLEGQEVVIITVAPRAGESYADCYLAIAQSFHQVSLPTSLKQIIVISSTSVYGDCDGAVVDETSILIPETPHQKILIDTEALYLALEPACKVAIARFGELVGEGRSLVDRVLSTQIFPGTGSNITNITTCDDGVRGVQFLINHQLSGVWNIVGDLHVTRKKLYTKIRAEHGLPPPQFMGNKTVFSGNKIVSNDKMRRLNFSFNSVLFYD